MKKLIFATLLVASSATVYAEIVKPESDVKSLTPAQKMKREKRLKKYGGYVYRIPDNPGKFAVLNAQRSLDIADFEVDLRDLSKFNCIGFDAANISDKVDVTTAGTVLKASGANGAVFIIDDPAYPISLVAAESKWGIVNIAPLKTGAKDNESLKKRARRELWRVFYAVAGAADADVQLCLLRPVFSGDDIEALVPNTVCPAVQPRVDDHLKAMGLKKWQRATYREACEAGWAPEPKDDYQKAIWAEYHTKPTQPIKIKFDKAKGE